MEDNNYKYEQSQDDDQELIDYPEKTAGDKTLRGYKIVISLLSILLVGISVLYFSIHRQQAIDNQLLQVDRDSIQSDLSQLMDDYGDMEIANDTLAQGLNYERDRADSIMQRLKNERSWNLSKIREYQSQVKLLRSIAAGYVRQIDSLNTLNKKLINENIGYRKEISTAQLRADMAEEKASELNNKVRQGSVLNASSISLVALNSRSKEITRVKRAERLRTDFILAANELSSPGKKSIYLRITSPDGYILTSSSMPTFEFEGEMLTYTASRDVDYQNQDVEVSIFFNSTGFNEGTYKVSLYCDGYHIGSRSILMK